jgi:hypothetical protein
MNICPDIAANVLGSVVKARADGGHRVDYVRIIAPLDHEEHELKIISRLFCEGCGSYSGLTRPGVDRLLLLANRPADEPCQGTFFLVGRCLVCDGDYQAARLVDVSKLTTLPS